MPLPPPAGAHMGCIYAVDIGILIVPERSQLHHSLRHARSSKAGLFHWGWLLLLHTSRTLSATDNLDKCSLQVNGNTKLSFQSDGCHHCYVLCIQSVSSLCGDCQLPLLQRNDITPFSLCTQKVLPIYLIVSPHMYKKSI